MPKIHRRICSGLKLFKQRQHTARRRMLFENLERRVVLNSDWQNPRDASDVNDDGYVSPLDALLVINELNRPELGNGSGGRLLPVRSGAMGSLPYFDCSGDGHLSPLDVLLVVNSLSNSSANSVGISKSSVSPSSTATSGEIRVNATVSGEQRVWDETNAVVTLASGGFIVAYSGKGTGDMDGVFARRFNADGSAVGAEIAVNAYKSGKQNMPAIAANATGDFVIVWNGAGAYDSNGIYFQRFRADGTRLGTEQIANTTTSGTRTSPNVGMAQDGSFVIAWEGKGPGDTNGVFYRRFKANGSANGGEQRVNVTTNGEQRQPQLAVGPDGRFAIAWYGKGPRDEVGIFLSRYDQAFGAIGREVLVNQTLTGSQYSPAIAMNEAGHIVVAWVGKGPGDKGGVFFRKLNPDGSFAGNETRANTTTKHKQITPAVALAPDNSFTVVWGSMQDASGGSYDDNHDDDDDEDEGDSNSDIIMQRFNSQRLKIGGEIIVNSTRTKKQENPSISTNTANQSTVVWSGEGVGDAYGVFAKQFGSGQVTNSPPVIVAVPSQSVSELSRFSLPIRATDIDLPNDALTYSLDVGPSGATIDPITGQLSWTPSEGQGPSAFSVVVRVVDRQSAFDTETFTISVAEVNEPPVLAQINNFEAVVGSEVTFRATAADTDLPSNQLTFSLGAGAPSGATINPQTGVFRWTPAPENGNKNTQFSIVVTDNGSPQLSDSQVVNIAVSTCAFPAGLNGWTSFESGGTAAGHGSVTSQNCVAIISEGDSFVSGLERSFTMPNNPAALQFTLTDLAFDTTAIGFIKDALEIAIVDQQGRLLVHSYTANRDTSYNVTEGLTPTSAPEIKVNGNTVTVDLAGIQAGTEMIAKIHLVNNDADRGTHLGVASVEFVAPLGTPASTTTGLQASQSLSAVDFSSLSDVTASVVGQYGRTSYNAKDQLLFTDLAMHNAGNYIVDAPLLVVVKNLSDPSIHVSNADGTTSDGSPYYNFAPLVTDGTLSPHDTSASKTLAFYNPNKTQFTYDIEVLGILNHVPTFTSDPDIEALVGKSYTYDVNATDLDSDAITFSLPIGPAGMGIDSDTGVINWTPATGDLGNQEVLVEVTDNRGGHSQQRFTISAIEPPPNRPPLFTSYPIVSAAIAARYTYDVKALDPDGDALSFAIATPTVEIPVANHSFESQVVAENEFTIGSLTDWTFTGGAFAGAANPGPSQYPDGKVPDGQNMAYSNDPALSQVLSERLRPNTRYVLKVAVGHRLDNTLNAFSIQLRAGGQILAAATSPIPPRGTFNDISVSYDSPTAHPMLGQPLEIRLSGSAGVNFDNVRITATEIFVPPSGMAINATTGVIAWTPTVDQLGSHEIRVLASDGRGGTATQAFNLQVEPDPKNRSPIIISEPTTSILIQPIPSSRSRQTIDFEGIPATPSFLQGSPVPPDARLSDRFRSTHGVTFRSQNGVPSIAVVNLGVGHATSGTNGIGGMGSISTIDFSTPFVAEFVVPDNPSIPALTDFVSVKVDRQGAQGTVVLQGFGMDGVLLESTSAVDNGFAVLTLRTPGIHTVVLRGTSNTAFDDFSFNAVYPAQVYEYMVRGVDPNNDTLTYSLTAAPFGMTIDRRTGLIKWPVASLNVGTPLVTVQVDDGRHGFDSQSFVVSPTTTPAKISGTVFNDINGDGVRDGSENGLVGRIVYLDKSDNYRRDPEELFATTDASGNYTFGDLTSGDYTIREEGQAGWRLTSPLAGANEVILNEGQVRARLDFGNAFTATSNAKPTIISTPPVTTTVGHEFIYHAVAADIDLDSLLFDLLVRPEGMIVDSMTGIVVWTPAANQVRDHDVILRVSDGRGGVDLQSFKVNVAAAQTAPVFTNTPPQASLVVAQSFEYRFTAQDAENDTLTYSLDQSSVGMSLNTISGLFSWTPGSGQLGNHTVTVSVSDGKGGQDHMTFSLDVVSAAANIPPVINSIPRIKSQLGGRYLYALEVVDENNDRINITLPAAPPGMVFDSTSRLIQWVPSAGQFGNNAVEIRVADGRGGVAIQSFVIDVTTAVSNETPRINSLPNETGMVDNLYAYNLRASDRDGDPLIWSLTTAPRGMSIDALLGTIRWVPAVDQLGPSNVTVLVTDAQGGKATQSFTINVRALNVPPNISSVPPTRGSVGQIYNYAMRAADSDGDSLSYSFLGAPSGMTINAVTGLVQWTPLVKQVGLQNVEVLVEDGHGGRATQFFTVGVVAAPTNHAPTITTTPTNLASMGVAYDYDADASDVDGDSLTFNLLVAPTGMSIDSHSGAIHWTPGVSQFGDFLVALAVNDTASVALQRYTIHVLSTNHPPAINSLPLQFITPGLDYRYDVLATDPDGNPLTYRLTSAPTGMDIDSFGRITWNTTIADIGTHSITVQATDPFDASVSQSYELTVRADIQPPKVFVDLSSPAAIGTNVVIFVSATDNVGIADLLLTVGGIPLSLDSSGRAEFKADQIGTIEVVATATDAVGNGGVVSTPLVVIDNSDVNAPKVTISSPSDDAVIRQLVDIIGTVEDTNLLFYTLEVAVLGSSSFTEIFRGTTVVSGSLLGKLDPTMLQNDTYVLRLTATDTTGNTATTEQIFHVAGELKLGNFNLSFVDLTIPVFGVPITVGRTYDTLTASQTSDFGFGWRLEYRNMNLRTSVSPSEFEEIGVFNPFKTGSRVYLTLPGGERQGFSFRPTLAAGFRGSFLGIFEPRFVPDAGVKSSLTVNAADLRFKADGTVYDYTTGKAYNPADRGFGGSYLLTTKQGIAYSVDAQTGDLTALSDPTNNVLQFSDAGITGPEGKSVSFERDPKGRITAVIDPTGHRVGYEYDARGDLVSVTDRTSNTTQFTYRSSPAHYLDKVIDPLGRTGVRTEYNAQGRLIKLLDAAGNPVQLTYDPVLQVNTVTDPLGNTTTEFYDQRGNTTRSIDALGGITSRTFDADNNPTSITDPLGRTTTITYSDRGDALIRTNPLGNTSISTYQAFTYGTTNLAAGRGQAAAPFTRLKTDIDALGNTTFYSYSENTGEILSTMDAMGNTISFEYDVLGRPPSAIKDPNGHVTQYVTANGLLTRQVDPLGHATTLTYDSNGNQLTSTITQTAADGTARSVVTRTDYDAEGRVIAVTDAEGGVSRTEYDSAGNKAATIDALGRRTEYRYDIRNLLVETVFPDDTPNDSTDNPRRRAEYDPAARKTASVDELGHRTEYHYDALGRLVKTIYPDGAFSNEEYDLASQLTAQIDERGNRTEFSYDAAGRQTSMLDALGNVVMSVYDTAGRKIAERDALGNTTRFVIDARGTKTETVYADGSKSSIVVDNRGQVSARTDLLGRTTRYEYDAARQLTAVVNALGQRTQYAYDETGNLIRQTDANGNVTRYEFDRLSRSTATVLPLGQRSEASYDAVGNVRAVKDFNGVTIAFAYDSRNQLTAKSFPDGTSVAYAYTFDRQLSSVTDSRGRTSYTYDLRDRLLSRNDPDGAQVNYGYDDAGNRTSLTAKVGATSLTTSYTFDRLNRLESVTDPSLGVTRYIYDAASNLIRTELPNGTTETRSYDDLNRLLFVENRGPSGVINSQRYTLAANGRRDAVVDDAGRRFDYTYDLIDRLNHEAITDAVFGNRTIDYTYDLVGNRLTRNDSVEGFTRYSYDANDRLLTETLAGDATRYSYDNNGNMLSRVSATDRVFYNWDFENRLISADTDGDGTIDVRNEYDANGIRVSQTVNGQETRFLIDTVQPFAQVLVEYRPGGEIIASYVRGHGLISQSRDSAMAFYHADGLGSIRAVTDVAGAVLNRYIYDAFGRVIHQSGSMVNPYQFAGEQRDAALGLDYLRARFLNPATGRFASADSFLGVIRDPISRNRYIYAAQNPVNLTDPSGHFFSLNESAIVGVVQQTLQTATTAISFKTISESISGMFDLLFLGIVGLQVAIELFDGLESGFTVRQFENEDGPGSIKGIEVKLSYQNGEDPILALEMEFKESPKFNFKLNLAHPSQSGIELGQEFHREIVKVYAGGLVPILSLDLVLDTQAYPSFGAKLGIEGKFGPGGLLKGKFSLLEFGGNDDT